MKETKSIQSKTKDLYQDTDNPLSFTESVFIIDALVHCSQILYLHNQYSKIMSLHKTTTLALKWLTVFMIVGIAGTANGQHQMHINSSPLSKAGNDIFGTIQEVIQKLDANPNTDWSQVDLEALRQHLLDMKAFTEEVKVISKDQIEKGVEVTVRPHSERAIQALNKLSGMHPAMIKREKGWDMSMTQNGDNWTIKCTTDDESEVAKIRALGYIGLLAEGAHHQLHHWMTATGHMDMN